MKRKQMSMIASLAALCLIVSPSCDSGPANDGAEPTPQPTPPPSATAEPSQPAQPEPIEHALFGTIDVGAELSALSGSLTVRPHLGGSTDERWLVAGDSVTITKPDGTTESATLEYQRPGELSVAVQQDDGTMRSHYAYARDGERIFIGLGQSGQVSDGRYIVRLSDGYVIGDGSACRYHQRNRGFEVTFDEAGVEVTCRVEGETLHYSYPDRYSGETREGQITIDGSALVSDQLRAHLISRD